MIRRRNFFAAVMSGVCLTGTIGVVGLVGGCGDSSGTSERTPDQEARDKGARVGMKEYMAAKKAEAGKRKKR